MKQIRNLENAVSYFRRTSRPIIELSKSRRPPQGLRHVTIPSPAPTLSAIKLSQPIDNCEVPIFQTIDMSKRMLERVSKIESLINYQSKTDRSFLWEALQAAGSPVRIAGDRPIISGNKKLAALGDAVADHWLWLELYRSPCTRGEGDNRRQLLFSNENLNRIGRSLGIEKLLILNPGTEFVSDEMVATMVEAVVGAVYLDGGMSAVEHLMENFGVHPTA